MEVKGENQAWQRTLLRRIMLQFSLVVLFVMGGLALTSNQFVELYLIESLLVLLLFLAAVGLLVWNSVREIVVEPQVDQLQQQSAEINKAQQAKDEFLATMSHELRTPLTVLLGSGKVLKESGLDESQQALLKTMDVSARSLLYMLDDILDLSKIDSGEFSLRWEPFSMRALIEDVDGIFPRRATDDGIEFKPELHGLFDHLLIGDEQRIRQIILNLCGNAVKFTDHGEVRLWVESLDEGPMGQGDWIRIVVEDEGIGMSPEVIDRLFLPFEQADSAISRRHGGTGLGLHISWRLIQLMGGMIQVESEVGKGSRFEVDLPLQKGEMDRHGEEAASDLFFEGRVLVAEDTR